MRISDWSSDVCSSDRCGLGKVTSGDKLTFFVGAVKGNNYVEALSNEGTRAASSELDSRIVAELAPKSAGTDVEVKLTRVDDGEAPSITRAIAPGLIVAMLGVVALVVGRLRSEEHTSELQSLMRTSYAV